MMMTLYLLRYYGNLIRNTVGSGVYNLGHISYGSIFKQN